jgi:phosphate-selective porin
LKYFVPVINYLINHYLINKTVEKIFMALNNFIKAACLSTCLGLASGSILANTYNVETNGGLHVYDSSDSDHWFNLNGKMQLDQRVNHQGKNFSHSLDLRAVQANVKGGVGQNLSYSFRLKRGQGNSVSMDKSQITYSGFNSWSKVSVGQVSMPYGLGTSFTEDSLATDMFSPNAGKDALGVALTAWNDKIGFMCSVHQPSNSLTSISSFDTAARVSFAPLMRDNLILHVGANAYMQQQSGNFDSALTNNSEALVSLNMNAEDKKRGFGLDAAVLRGPVFLQAELHQVSVGQDNTALGYNVEASYAVTGESRDYNKVTGSFSNVGTEADGGSWQVSARHSAVHHDSQKHRTVGASVAWTVNNNLTVLANYENAISANNQGALSLRLQAAW